MEEVELLCNRAAIIDMGKIVAIGRPFRARPDLCTTVDPSEVFPLADESPGSLGE